MDHRTHEGAMDWEYNSRGPMDPTSPYTSFTQNHCQTSKNNSVFNSNSSVNDSPEKPLPAIPTPFGSKYSSNPFAATPRTGTPAKGSLFDPDVQRRHIAQPFKNPSFTTPRKPHDDISFSEMSGAESSPLANDADISELPIDSPEFDYNFSNAAISPSRSNRAFMYGRSPMVSSRPHVSGKGEIPRGKYGHLDKIRKRKRHNDDRDVATVRHRIEAEVSGSDLDDADVVPRAVKGDGRKKKMKESWLGGFLASITANPTAPDILVSWLQFLLRGMVIVMAIYFVWIMFLSIKRDMNLARDQAISERLGNITLCQHHYHANRCDPASQRPPALQSKCEEWELCMHQDPNDVQSITLGVRQVVELLNELVSAMHYKTMAFIGGFSFLVILASRPAAGNPPQVPMRRERSRDTSSASGVPFGYPTEPGQAFIFAPIQTPHKLKNRFVLEEGTPTDIDTTPPPKSIMPAFNTPSGRRIPSKERGLRSLSPVKNSRRSPSKGY